MQKTHTFYILYFAFRYFFERYKKEYFKLMKFCYPQLK